MTPLPPPARISASGINKNIVGHMVHVTIIVKSVGLRQTDIKIPQLSRIAKVAEQKMLSDYLSGIVCLLNLIY